MNERARNLVEAATVRLPEAGGQGVLVPNGYVLTAAHCVTWNPEGGMALGDFHLERFETRTGAQFMGSICAVEAVADIAALNAPDSQTFSKWADAFESFCEATSPVPLSARERSPTAGGAGRADRS